MADSADPVLSVLTRQRACRDYRPDPVDEADIRRLLVCATHAPSAENRQPWQFVVATDPDRRARIWSLARRAWEGGGREVAAATISPEMHAEVDRGITTGFEGAPVSIVVGADLDRVRPETIGSSLFPAVQNMLVAATALGLGSALTTIAAVFADELGTIVGFPATVRPVAVVPIGHPSRPLGSPRREPVEDHAHREEYGNDW